MNTDKIFLFLILTLFSCNSTEKSNWQERLRAKESIRFQIPVFEIDNLTREKRISLSNEFASIFTKHSGYSAVVLDDKIKTEFINRNESIPSTNFAIQSKFSHGVLRLLVLDLETGEILSHGKMELSSEEDLTKQFERVIEEQLLKGK